MFLKVSNKDECVFDMFFLRKYLVVVIKKKNKNFNLLFYKNKTLNFISSILVEENQMNRFVFDVLYKKKNIPKKESDKKKEIVSDVFVVCSKGLINRIDVEQGIIKNEFKIGLSSISCSAVCKDLFVFVNEEGEILIKTKREIVSNSHNTYSNEKKIRLCPNDKASSVCISSSFVSVGLSNGTIRSFDLKQRKEISFIENRTNDSVSSIVFIKENLIAVGFESGLLRIWNIKTPELIEEFNENVNKIKSLSFFKETLFSQSSELSFGCKQLDNEKWIVVESKKNKNESVWCFSRKRDKIVKAVDWFVSVETKRKDFYLNFPKEESVSSNFSSSNSSSKVEIIVTANRNIVNVFKKKKKFISMKIKKEIQAVSVSKDGEQLCVVSDDNKVSVYDIKEKLEKKYFLKGIKTAFFCENNLVKIRKGKCFVSENDFVFKKVFGWSVSHKTDSFLIWNKRGKVSVFSFYDKKVETLPFIGKNVISGCFSPEGILLLIKKDIFTLAELWLIQGENKKQLKLEREREYRGIVEIEEEILLWTEIEVFSYNISLQKETKKETFKKIKQLYSSKEGIVEY